MVGIPLVIVLNKSEELELCAFLRFDRPAGTAEKAPKGFVAKFWK
jgi:hypothetical protein